ncbi:MAG: hypothetical protein ACI8R4_003441 [Paracoccaceae bacterium]|jgi:hypothetical protein
MRVDVGADFYTSVAPEEAAIVRAAQSLGRCSFQGDQLQALLDGMPVDALRSVAAGMTMDELHENRAGFVAAVRDRLTEVFLRKLAEVIAKSKKDRAQTDADAQVSVRKVAVAASRQTLEIDLEERRAQIALAQEIEALTAAQITEVAWRKAERKPRRGRSRYRPRRRGRDNIGPDQCRKHPA